MYGKCFKEARCLLLFWRLHRAHPLLPSLLLHKMWEENKISAVAEMGDRLATIDMPEGDIINRSRRNLACKRGPWVCYSTPKLALIGKRASIQEPPKMSKFAQNCSFWPPEADTMNTFRWNLAGKCRPWVCSNPPNLALIGKRGSVQKRQKVSKFAQNCGFWPQGADTMNTFRWNLAGKCRPCVCSNAPNLTLIGKRGSVEELRKMSKFAQNCGFWSPEASNLVVTVTARCASRDTLSSSVGQLERK